MYLGDQGRTIIHVINHHPTTPLYAEVMFTCPECGSDARAYHGVGGGTFLGRGFALAASTSVPVPTTPSPYSFESPVLMRGLSWDDTGPHNLSANDPNRNINYWQDGGSCTPSLSISGGNILGACNNPPGSNFYPNIQAGTVQATTWSTAAGPNTGAKSVTNLTILSGVVTNTG